jgi:hypothetical protein
MLQLQSQSKFVTKILKTESGDTYRVFFLVSLVNGQINAEVVNAELISSYDKSVKAVCLPCTEDRSVPEAIESVYFVDLLISSLNKLDFFISQPTRAPSLI